MAISFAADTVTTVLKAARVIGVTVMSLSILVLIITAASWADSSHSSPLCGSQLMQSGEVCHTNGVDTTYDEAVQQAQNARNDGPIGVAVSSAFLVGSIVLLVVVGRKDRRKTSRR